MALKADKGQNFFTQYFILFSISCAYYLVIFCSLFNGVQKPPNMTILVVFVVNRFDWIYETGSKVGWHWREATAKTFDHFWDSIFEDLILINKDSDYGYIQYFE